MESTAQKVVGFKRKRKRSNDFNAIIDKLSTEQKTTECRFCRQKKLKKLKN